jgi:hypothetical protein
MFEDIQKLFLNEHGSYSKLLQFQTLIIIFLIIVFFTHAFKNNYGFIIILLSFAIFIANSYVTVQNNTLDDFNNVTMIKLQSLQQKVNEYIDFKIKLTNNSNNKMSAVEIQKIYESNQMDSLYIDANMIHFLDSIIKVADFNLPEFYLLIKGTNNILKIQKEIETFYEANNEYPLNTSEMFETALDLRTHSINNLHNFIYSIPKTNAMYKYLSDIVDRYSVLISRSTDKIDKYYKNNLKQRDINSSTKFVTYNTVKPFDTTINHTDNKYKLNKLIPFST